MVSKSNRVSNGMLIMAAGVILIMGIILLLIPPALFPDTAQGFQVLNSMQSGSGFNTFVSPDQGYISQNYTEFLSWWSPGQYLIPYFFQLITGMNTGQGIAIAVSVAGGCGLSGFYYFFKKIGFTPIVTAFSLVFIVCQQAFMIPYVFYNGGEIMLFSFLGWFLYGCVSLEKNGLKLVLFIMLSAFIGFFLKSSFLWVYCAGLVCLWARLSAHKRSIAGWVKNGFWIGVPAVLSVALIYIFYISKGESPLTNPNGFKLTAQTFGFPIASPVLSGFSADDLVNGLIVHNGKPIFNSDWIFTILLLAALLSVLLIAAILLYLPNSNYKLLLAVFYLAAILFFGFSYLRQFPVSMDARHFRVVGLLIVPGVIYLVARFKPFYKYLFAILVTGIAFHSFFYLITGYNANYSSAKGITGIAQPHIDQPSLNEVMQLDRKNHNAVFVFIGDDTGLEILHNRFISLPPIGGGLKINIADYRYEGIAGPLYIILPESYNGPKEKMIMKSFPGYTGFNISMLSDKYVLYAAKLPSNLHR